ncbi:lipid A biosynthesis acyltransferase [Methylophilaceae bacterium]|jgi:Kdo2-lipid IVA lauroyltransferase/acyltransferase|nr:lipid A biosynthesis acyltransferase [Methylophilaceae bacterium]
MIQSILTALIKLILRILPLFIIQYLGILLGKLFHYLRPNIRAMLIKNIKSTGIFKTSHTLNNAINENINETGKTIIESLAIWANSQNRVLKWIKNVKGEGYIEKAKKVGKGIIFLTPHMGAYEITSIYYGLNNPLTILYRPPRKNWLVKFMNEGRKKGFIKLAPTKKTGIKKILLALRKGEAVGILPDQVAKKGEGEWAPFFNRPAYTMNLASRLAKKTGASVIMVYGERLSLGKGFIIHLEPIKLKDIKGPKELNQQLEKQILKNPTQYLWNYDKHKGCESQLDNVA